MEESKLNLLFKIFLYIINIVVILFFGFVFFELIYTKVIDFQNADNANSISGYFELFASLGIPLYAVREIAKNREDNKLQNINSIEIFWTNLINATIVFAIYFLFVTLVYGIGTISFWVFIIE